MATELERLVVKIEADVSDLRRELNRAQQTSTRASQRMARSFVTLNRRIGETTRSLTGLRTALATGLGALAVRDLFRAQVAFDRIQNSLLGATGDARLAGREFEFLRSEAQRLGLDLQSSALQFARLAAAAKNTAIEGQGARDIFTAVAEASTVMGLSAEQTGGAITALEQIIGKGVVSMEEIRQQLSERIPGALRIAAAAMDMTVQEFSELVAQGEIFSDEFIPRFARQLRREFGAALPRAIDSARANMNRFNTALFELRVQLAQSGIMEGLVTGLENISEILRDPATQEGMRAFGQTLGAGLQAAAEHAEILLRLMAALAGASVGARVGGGVGAGAGGLAGFFAPEIFERMVGQVQQAQTELDKLRDRLALVRRALRDLEEAGNVGAANVFLQREGFEFTIPNESAFQQTLQNFREEIERLEAAQRRFIMGRGLEARLNTRDPLPVAPRTGRGGGGGADDRARALAQIERTVGALEREAIVVTALENERAALRTELRLEDLAREGQIGNIEEYVSRARVAIFVTQQAAREAELAAIAEEERADALARLTSVQEGLQGEAAELRKRLEFRGEETEELRVQLRLLEIKRDLEAEITPEIEQRVRANEAMRTSLEEMTESTEELQTATSQLGEIAQQMGFSFSSAFEDAILDAKSFQDVLLALQRDIARVFLRQLFTQPLFGGIAAGVQGQTLPGGGLGGLVSGGVASLFGGGDQTQTAGSQAADDVVDSLGNLATVGGSTALALETTGSGATVAGEGLAGPLVGGIAETVASKAVEVTSSNAASTGLTSVAAASTAAATAISAMSAAAAASQFSGFTVGGGSGGGGGGAATAARLFSRFTVGGSAMGGMIHGPGTGTSDSIPRMLSRGEFVVNARQTQRFRPLLEGINSGAIPGMAAGGPVGNPRIPRMQRGGIVAGTSAQAGGINIFLPPGNNQPRDFHRNYLGLGMTRAMVHGQLMDTLDTAARKDS